MANNILATIEKGVRIKGSTAFLRNDIIFSA